MVNCASFRRLYFRPTGCAHALGLVWLAGFGLLHPTILSAATHPLNVDFISADDLGASDLACYGTDLHETPPKLSADRIRSLTAQRKRC